MLISVSVGNSYVVYEPLVIVEISSENKVLLMASLGDIDLRNGMLIASSPIADIESTAFVRIFRWLIF